MSASAPARLSPRYAVVFRTCEPVASVHRNARPFGNPPKPVVARACFRSLVQALKTVPHEIHVVGDRLSDRQAEFFGSHAVHVTNGNFGNDESIRQSLARALSFPDDTWVYLCEDDYLHQPHAFTVIDELIAHRDTYLTYKIRPPFMFLLLGGFSRMPLVINPADDPNRYLPNRRFLSFLFLSKYCHWRQVSNTTFTFLAQASTLKRYRGAIAAASHGAKDKRLSRAMYARFFFRRKALCLSPIPGLASHLHDGVMSPFGEWERIWEEFSAG